ncbi:hypothetical protein C7271_18700 [filamentous cyanobacterium CCP5]|nr:hypothetical protein C7271_18700 [filamentous cyanobacterium CCP5]
MTASNLSPETNASAVMAAAATADQRPSPAELARAMLLAEKSVRGQQLDVKALVGVWQLRFTVPKKPRLKDDQPTQRGFYIPRLVQAEIGFQTQPAPTPLAIHNQLKLGPLILRLTGNAKPVGKNLIAFEFNHVQVSGGRFTLYRGQIHTSPLPPSEQIGKAAFFSFFATASDYIAARGRGGGLALWARTEANMP